MGFLARFLISLGSWDCPSPLPLEVFCPLEHALWSCTSSWRVYGWISTTTSLPSFCWYLPSLLLLRPRLLSYSTTSSFVGRTTTGGGVHSAQVDLLESTCSFIPLCTLSSWRPTHLPPMCFTLDTWDWHLWDCS